MHSVPLRWRTYAVRGHTAMLYAGVVLGMTAGNIAANLAGLDSARVLVAQLLLLVFGLIGARLLHLSIHLDFYRHNPTRVWDRRGGGASQLGGLILMLPLSVVLLDLLSLPLGRFWDLSTFTLLIGVALGKLGCLWHGCCGGRPLAGRHAPRLTGRRKNVVRRIPTQLLESLLALSILCTAAYLWSLAPPPGTVFLGALLAYALGRLALQSTREHQDVIAQVNVQRVVSMALAATALAGLAIAMGAASYGTPVNYPLGSSLLNP